MVVAIAKLFSCHLDSEEEMKSVFVPTLNKMATTDLECFNEVAVCMLILLVKKIPENGISLVRNVVTDEVSFSMYIWDLFVYMCVYQRVGRLSM